MKDENFKKIADAIPELSKEKLQVIVDILNATMSMQEKFFWRVKWELKKFLSAELEEKGELAVPYDTVVFNENLTLDSGIEMLWKVVAGINEASVVPFSNANARLAVGSSFVAEDPAQTGVQTPIGNAGMDPTYPQVSGRSIVFASTFGSDVANGEWKEASIMNGNGANAVALNRKVKDLGRKAEGTSWTLRVTVSGVTEPETP